MCLFFIVCLISIEANLLNSMEMCITHKNFKLKTPSQPRNVEFRIPKINFGGRCTLNLHSCICQYFNIMSQVADDIG